ncbi:hypothetical protein BCT81_09835 [Vibrio sp. 10N.261.52.A1]|nr:hypothetical protein BCT81_09835 [Vibrio sp. 10N.261.52.A1]
MIRIDVNANHGAGMPLSKAIDFTAYICAFTLFNMGQVSKYISVPKGARARLNLTLSCTIGLIFSKDKSLVMWSSLLIHYT